MKKTLTVYDLKEAFVEADRDYYSFEGLEALLWLLRWTWRKYGTWCNSYLLRLYRIWR